jgi:hypothetical protein
MRLLLQSEAALVLLSLLTGLSRRLLDRGAAGYATLSCAAGREWVLTAQSRRRRQRLQ